MCTSVKQNTGSAGFLQDGIGPFFQELIPKLQDPAQKGPIQCLNVYKFKQALEYPDDWHGERGDSVVAAFELFAKNLHDICTTRFGGRIMYFGERNPFFPSLDGGNSRDVADQHFVQNNAKRPPVTRVTVSVDNRSCPG